MIQRVVKQVWSDLLNPLWREKKPLTPAVIIAPTPSSSDSQPSIGTSVGPSSNVTSELCFDFSLGNTVNSAETHAGGNEDVSNITQVALMPNPACGHCILLIHLDVFVITSPYNRITRVG